MKRKSFVSPFEYFWRFIFHLSLKEKDIFVFMIKLKMNADRFGPPLPMHSIGPTQLDYMVCFFLYQKGLVQKKLKYFRNRQFFFLH